MTEVEAPIQDERTRRLWLKVIQQVVAEAEGKQLYDAKQDEIPGLIYRARKWLTTRSRSLVETCSLAGLGIKEIDFLVERYQKLYGKGKNKKRGI